MNLGKCNTYIALRLEFFAIASMTMLLGSIAVYRLPGRLLNDPLRYLMAVLAAKSYILGEINDQIHI